jgi:predicted DNA-binding WGR domain protein
MACYLECSEGGAAKFWQCQVIAISTKVTFGKLGTLGTSQVKEHGSEAKANQFFAKMKSDKMRKGYKEVASADNVPTQDARMKEVEPKSAQNKKRPVAAAEEPPKKQQKTLPNDIPRAKRTTKNGVPCFRGCIFVRTGRFLQQKALKDLVESCGGEFTKNAKKATHCLDGGAEIFVGFISDNSGTVLANGGAVVPLPVSFPRSSGDKADAAYLAKSMEISESVSEQEFRENFPLQKIFVKHLALANAFVKDSDLMSATSAYPSESPGNPNGIELKGKKLLEPMESILEAAPSEKDVVPLLGPIY